MCGRVVVPAGRRVVRDHWIRANQRNRYTHFKGHRSINDGLLNGIAEIVLRRPVRLLKHQHCRQFFDRVGP